MSEEALHKRIAELEAEVRDLKAWRAEVLRVAAAPLGQPAGPAQGVLFDGAGERDKAARDAAKRAELSASFAQGAALAWTTWLQERNEKSRPCPDGTTNLLKQRLREGNTLDTILAAVRGVCHDQWCVSNNMMTIGQALKSQDSIERYAAVWRDYQEHLPRTAGPSKARPPSTPTIAVSPDVLAKIAEATKPR